MEVVGDNCVEVVGVMEVLEVYFGCCCGFLYGWLCGYDLYGNEFFSQSNRCRRTPHNIELAD